MSLNARDEPPYVVPDFAADNEIRKRYNDVNKALLSSAIAAALRKLQDEHEFQRLRLEANKRAAQTVLSALEGHAHSMRSKYARIVPKQRTASGIVRPPAFFFDTLITMGTANKLYNQALEAQNLKREATLRVRTTTRELDQHVGKLEAALVVRELEVRKHFKSLSGRLELERDPRLLELANQCAAIDAERADYDARLLAATVSDEELRDRTMAADGYRYLEGDVRGLHCLHDREVRYGALRYLMFRDRENRIWVVDYALEILPLTQMRFDVLYLNDRYLIQRSPPPGRSVDEPRTGKHEGIDPRAYMGVDPLLRQALRDFVAREKGIDT